METNQETTQVNTGLTSEHKAFVTLFLAGCIVLVIFITSLARVSMNEDELAAKVAKDQGAVAAYCLYKTGAGSPVCSILASKGEVE